jgi:hypothetical protein
MTPAPDNAQQPEYTITGKQMSRVYNSINLQEAAIVMDEIRDSSRPHTPAPDTSDDANPLGDPFIPRKPEWLLLAEAGITTKTEIPKIIPPLPTGDTTDLKVWHEYWKQHDATIARNATLAALSLLEEWDYHNNRNFLKPHPTFHDMIRLVREKPEETRKHVESLRQSATAGADPK